jgi:peptide/nickel transport system permease protein/oligopeptide transport system permease protein
MVAGYVGGRTDGAMMRAVDVLYSLPSIIFVIVLITTLHGALDKLQSAGKLTVTMRDTAKFVGLFFGLGAVSWLTMARIVRGQVLSLRTRQFVDASRALGATHAQILFRHILPNITGIIIVYLMLLVPAIILYESFLSYLGLGIQPPQASLGSLIADGAAQINPIRIYWWLLVFPCSVLVSTLLALNFFGAGFLVSNAVFHVGAVANPVATLAVQPATAEPPLPALPISSAAFPPEPPFQPLPPLPSRMPALPPFAPKKKVRTSAEPWM